MSKSEQNANRQLAATARLNPKTVERIAYAVLRFFTAHDVARVIGVDPYNDTRGLAVRS